MPRSNGSTKRRLLCLGLATLFGVQGCANVDSGSLNPSTWSGGQWANCGLSVAGGAVLGTLLGHKKKGQGAAIGALGGMAACFAINARSVQTQTKEQVDTQYKEQRSAAPRVVSYQTNIRPAETVARGKPFQIVSDIVALDGRSQPVSQISETVRLYSPEGGAPFKEATKVANPSGGGGGYQNTFTITMPDGVPSGAYRIETSLMLNNQPANSLSNRVQLVMVGGHEQKLEVASVH